MPTAHTPTFLALKNPHPRDANISFQEEGHIYTVCGQTDYTSVTTFIHSHFRHFDAEAIADKILTNRKYKTDPSYKYYQRSKEDILAEWAQNGAEASKLGTQMHYNIELFYNEESPAEPDTSLEYQYFLRFQEDHKDFTAFRTEYLVYYEEYKISGSIDMVFLNPDGKTYSIYDWKRVKAIEYESSFGNQGGLTECISHLPDTNCFHYSLQLSLYRYILERKYGMIVTDLCLVVMHPDHPNKTYEKVHVQYLEKEVEDLLAYWKREYLDKGIQYQKPNPH